MLFRTTISVLTLFAAAPAWAQYTPAEITAPLAAPSDPAAYFADRVAAFEAVDARDYARAEPILERLVASYALDARVWARLGITKIQLGKRDDAIAAYQRVMALGGPGFARSRARIGFLQMLEGNTDAALATLDLMVNDDAYLDRPGLMGDEDTVALRDNPRFRQLAGAIDTSDMSREQGWRTDLDYLMAEIRRLSPRHRQGDLPAVTAATYRELYENVGHLSDEQMFAGMARLVGALNQNHTMMWGIAPGAPLPNRPTSHFLPVHFYFFPEGVFIVGGADATHDLVGAQVISIDGEPILEAFARVREAMSVGGAGEALWAGPWRLMDASLLNGLGITDRAERVSLRLRLRNGRTVTRVISATQEPIIAKLPPPAGIRAPAFLSHMQESHWLETWADSSTIYAQVNQIRPDEDETLPAFGLRLRQTLAETGARNLVLDLRHNNGGDTSTYIELARTLIAFSAQSNHQLYVLIGRNTYSAAANLTTDLERFADPIFIGEPTGATGNQEGDEGAVRLPYSGLRANIAGVLWQLSDPWDERRFVAPHAPVQLTAADYFAGRDPALDVTRTLIARRSTQ